MKNEEVKLKPCPFCGGEAERYETDAGCVKVNCRKCHIETPWGKHRFETDDIDKWNYRTPEPGTSVIRWTRYDGTPETLPKIDDFVLLNDEDVEFSRYIGDRKFRPSWTRILHIEIEIGDLWAYIPEPPEGME